MDNTVALLIRACKSLRPKARVQSVYRRFYNGETPAHPATLNHILVNIVEKYELITVSELIHRADPDHIYFYGEDVKVPYDIRVSRVLSSVIRHAPITAFPDLPTPLKFKHLDKL